MSSPPLLDGSVALVTGASSGIGREIALLLAGRVKALVLVARRADRLESLRNELKTRYADLSVEPLPCDIGNEEEVSKLIGRVRAEIGPVDILVNNAGLGLDGLFDRADWERTRQLLSVNVIAVVHLTQAFLPDMVARGRGGVLNIGSGAGLTVMPSAAAYVASKHFIDGFSEALRADLAGTGVVVTQVAPGPVDSEFDQVAGSVGGMQGGPPRFVRIGAAQAAHEAIAGFERGDALVFPGRPYRFVMRFMLPLLSRTARRRQAERAAQRVRARSTPR
jgi:uncharacterized protein